ncbi:unnamed protein product, partial [Arabidopsis halleri]
SPPFILSSTSTENKIHKIPKNKIHKIPRHLLFADSEKKFTARIASSTELM